MFSKFRKNVPSSRRGASGGGAVVVKKRGGHLLSNRPRGAASSQRHERGGGEDDTTTITEGESMTNCNSSGRSLTTRSYGGDNHILPRTTTAVRIIASEAAPCASVLVEALQNGGYSHHRQQQLSVSSILLPTPDRMVQTQERLRAIDRQHLDAVQKSWEVITTQLPGDYKKQLGKQILFTMAGIEKNTCELLGLESVLRPPVKVSRTSLMFANTLEDLVECMTDDDDTCHNLLVLAPVLERRGFPLSLLFPAFCQAVPTAVRRLLHGDWNDDTKQAWEQCMKCAEMAILATAQHQQEC